MGHAEMIICKFNITQTHNDKIIITSFEMTRYDLEKKRKRYDIDLLCIHAIL
jgi:hypothetical protein